MFPSAYFGDRPFAPRYFPKVGAVPVPPVIVEPYRGDTTIYDLDSPTGSITGGTVLDTEYIYDT